MYADIVDSINPGNWDVAKTFYGEAVAELLIDGQREPDSSESEQP